MAPMKLPARKSTLFLALFLLTYGGAIVLNFDKVPGLNQVIQSFTGLLALAAGVFAWLDK
jgi:hypothetical protein